MAKTLKPTPINIARVRLDAGLTQHAAATLVAVHRSRWVEYEAGRQAMDPARWELFLILCGRHADWLPAPHVNVPRAQPSKVTP